MTIEPVLPQPVTKRQALADVGVILAVLAVQVAILLAIREVFLVVPAQFRLFASVLPTAFLSLVAIWFLLRRRHLTLSSIGLVRLPTRVLIRQSFLALLFIYLASAAGGLVYYLFEARKTLSPTTAPKTSSADLEGAAEAADPPPIPAERLRLFASLTRISRWTVLPITVVVGIYEEVVFRGLILHRLWLALGRAPIALIISAAIFGLLHVDQGPLGATQAFAIGIALGWFVIRRGNLWPAIGAHVLFNTITIFLAPVLLDFVIRYG